MVIHITGEKETVRIQTWERVKFQERKLSIKDISEYFQKQNDASIPITMNKSDTKINYNNDTSETSSRQLRRSNDPKEKERSSSMSRLLDE